jgi:hypothetical protein
VLDVIPLLAVPVAAILLYRSKPPRHRPATIIGTAWNFLDVQSLDGVIGWAAILEHGAGSEELSFPGLDLDFRHAHLVPGIKERIQELNPPIDTPLLRLLTSLPRVLVNFSSKLIGGTVI